MNVGVLGTGFGAYHAELLMRMERIDRVIVFGRNEDKLQQLKEKLGVEITTNIEDIILDSTIDVVDICLPPHLHRQYTIDALKNGKHVFCETPVCCTEEDALAIKEAEQRYGARVLVNQFIKFDPAYKYFYDTIQNKKHGRILSFTLTRETPPIWGDLGLHSIATNLMIHELDFVTWVLGSINDYMVWAHEGKQPEQALVRALFNSSDISAEVIVSSQMPESYPFSVGYEAYFEHGKLVFKESDHMNGTVEASLVEYTSSGKQEITLEQVNIFEKSIAHAIQSLEDQSPSLLELDHALVAINLAIGIKKACISG